MKDVRGARGQGGDLGRGRVHARRHLRLPDRADAGARRGARPGGRRRRLPRADGGPPRDLARRRREHDRAARRRVRRRRLPATEFVGYEKTDVLTAVVALGPLGDGRFSSSKLERVAVLRRGRRPGQRHAATSCVDGDERAARARRRAQVRRRPGARRRDGGERCSQAGRASAPSSTGRRASRRWRTTPRPTCCTRRCARCSATTSSRPARRCGPTSCASTSRTRSRSRRRSASGSSGIVNEKVFEAIPVRTFVTPIDEARKLGAMMLFGEKYGERGARRRDRRLLARALRRHARPLDRRDRAVRDHSARAPSAPARAGSRPSPPGEAWALLHGRSRELDDVARRARAAHGARRRSRSEAEAGADDRARAWRSSTASSDRRRRSRGSTPTRCSTSPTASSSGARRRRSCSARARTARSTSSRTSTRASRRSISAGDVVKRDRADRRRRRRRAADDGAGGRQAAREAPRGRSRGRAS